MPDNLKEEFTTIHSEIEDVITKAKDEKRDLTEDEQKTTDEKFARLETIKKLQAEETKLASLTVDSVKFDNKLKGHGEPAQPKAKFANQPSEKEEFTAHVAAVNTFIRTGERSEKFTIVAGPTGTNGNNGISLPASPPVVLRRMANPFKAVLAAFGRPVLVTPGYQNIPIIDDRANTADVIEQNSTGENVKEAVVTNYLAGDKLYDSGTQWHSSTLLESLNYDLLSFIRPALDARIERAEMTAWTSNITTGAGAAPTAVTLAGANPTFDELLKLKWSVGADYQNELAFIFSAGLMQSIEGLKDTNGRPLYVASLSDDAPDRFMGRPIFVTDALGDGLSAVSGIAVPVSSLHIREAGARRLAVYRDYPLRPDQVGLRAFQNGGFVFTPGVQVLKRPSV